MTLFNDTRHLFVRSLKKLIRNPILIFFSLFQPIIFLLLFTQLFSKFAQAPGLFPAGVSYLAYATPGILLQNGFSSALQSGTSIVDDINSGFLQKMLVTPVSRAAILLGRLTADAFRVTVQSIIIILLAYAIGFSVATGLLGILAILGIVAFFGLAWSGISLALGLRTRSADFYARQLQTRVGLLHSFGHRPRPTLQQDVAKCALEIFLGFRETHRPLLCQPVDRVPAFDPRLNQTVTREVL